MKIVEYNNANDIVVEFQDEYKTKIHTAYHNFKNGKVKNKINRLGKVNYNNEGVLMKIINYSNAKDIVVEFQDEYKAKVHTQYNHFLKGEVKNPYYPSVCGVGMIGNKYPVSYKYKDTKEYSVWRGMLYRCFDEKTKEKCPAYKNATCCDEWLLFDNFYEWLHSQENFDKWLNNKMWALDKDIINKGNNIYSPKTCCLVPQNINSLFVKNDARRGSLPIGIERTNNKFRTINVYNMVTKESKRSSLLNTQEKAFEVYKKYKEDVIKCVAKSEYTKGNITKVCYNAMMNYKVEIDD